MSNIIINTFTISIDRQIISKTKTIVSNLFTLSIDRTLRETIIPSAEINIYKGTSLLQAVPHTPSKGEYQVIISKTTNCTASLSFDNKKILVAAITSNKGEIDVVINIENKIIYTKTISVVAITDSQILKNSINEVEQIIEKIELLKNSNLTNLITTTDELLTIIVQQVNFTGNVLSGEDIDSKELVGIKIRNSSNIFRIDLNGNIKGISIIESEGENFQIRTEGLMELKK